MVMTSLSDVYLLGYGLGSLTTLLIVGFVIYVARVIQIHRVNPVDRWLDSEYVRLSDTPDTSGEEYVQLMRQYGQLRRFIDEGYAAATDD